MDLLWWWSESTSSFLTECFKIGLLGRIRNLCGVTPASSICIEVSDNTMISYKRSWPHREVVITERAVLDTSSTRVGRRGISKESRPIRNKCPITAKPVYGVKDRGVSEATKSQKQVYTWEEDAYDFPSSTSNDQFQYGCPPV